MRSLIRAFSVSYIPRLTCLIRNRAAQIRAGIWRRNGPGMNDQVLNYSEPPFCRGLADADMLLLQFSLLCHSSRVGGRASMGGDDPDSKDSIARLAFAGQGTARLTVSSLHVMKLWPDQSSFVLILNLSELVTSSVWCL